MMMMPPLSMESSVSYAKSLLPGTLVKCLSSVQTTLSRRVVPAPRLRCFDVCAHNRRRTSSLEAPSLADLVDQAARVFLPVSSQHLTLVLEEDGTVVDCEAFFQSLPSHTLLMVLEGGQAWTESKFGPTSRKPRRIGIAKLTFDLYKLHPKEFLGCLSVRATFYEMYMFSYDLRCTRARPVIKGSIRLLNYTARLAGQLLLYGAMSAQRVLGDDDYDDGYSCSGR